MNVARAVGPALAGLLLTQVDAWLVFGLNSAVYGLLAVVVLRWGPAGRVSGDMPERFGAALRAGTRYVRHSRVVRRLLLRSALFVLPGTALWALLPLVASRLLGLGSGGYGLLLGALGVGAVAGAVVLPRLLTRVTTGVMIFLASVVFAAARGRHRVRPRPAARRRPPAARRRGVAGGALHRGRRHAGLPSQLGAGPRPVRPADRHDGRSGGGRPGVGDRCQPCRTGPGLRGGCGAHGSRRRRQRDLAAVRHRRSRPEHGSLAGATGDRRAGSGRGTGADHCRLRRAAGERTPLRRGHATRTGLPPADRRHALEPLPRRRRSGPLPRDVPGALLGRAPPSAPRTTHSQRPGHRQGGGGSGSGPPDVAHLLRAR